jgi:hypothetical protein
MPVLKTKHKWLVGALLLFSLLALLLAGQPTNHNGPWQISQARLPEVMVDGERYRIRHIRDFRYHPHTDILHTQYLDQVFLLDDLQAVWLGISHFANHGLAHTFLSFEFTDDRYLVASVEARLRPGQRYHPLQGLFNRYHKIIVLGSEEDVIGLRSHLRGERVLLYPLQLSTEQQRHVFIGMMTDIQALARQPRFYHTLLDNCTTSLLRHDPTHRLWKSLLDYRILLPGFADAYALQRGWIQTEMDLPDLRKEARIRADISPDEANFSTLIRRPAYQQLDLSMLVMQQNRLTGRAIRTHGMVRGFAGPRHYWVEDGQLNRVALEPGELAAAWLGRQVEVAGRFYYHPEEGRRLVLDAIQPLDSRPEAPE